MNYTWKLKGLRKTNTQSVNNAIVQTYWEKTGVDENGNDGTFVGATPFDLSTIDPDNFISYEDLTEEIILGWIESVASSYEDHINEQIQRQINIKASSIVEVTDSLEDGKENFPWIKSE